MATLNQSSCLASRIMQAVPLFGGWDTRPIWFTDDDAWTAWVGITALARPQRGSGPLPALGSRDNGTRADAARVALESYVATNTPLYANEPLEEKVSDLLCDLLHLVRRDGTEGELIDGEPQSDPTDLLDRARSNFEEEEAEEE